MINIMIALSHFSLFVSDWRRQVGGLLVKTYRHGISEIFLKMVCDRYKTENDKWTNGLVGFGFFGV
jgi:hypothetical protein